MLGYHMLNWVTVRMPILSAWAWFQNIEERSPFSGLMISLNSSKEASVLYKYKYLKKINVYFFFFARRFKIISSHLKMKRVPWLVWLSGLSAGLQTKGSLVPFPVRAHAWVGGQVCRGSVWGATTHWCFSPSLSPSLPLSLKKNK